MPSGNVFNSLVVSIQFDTIVICPHKAIGNSGILISYKAIVIKYPAPDSFHPIYGIIGSKEAHKKRSCLGNSNSFYSGTANVVERLNSMLFVVRISVVVLSTVQYTTTVNERIVIARTCIFKV